jgi:hypothetical protein
MRTLFLKKAMNNIFLLSIPSTIYDMALQAQTNLLVTILSLIVTSSFSLKYVNQEEMFLSISQTAVNGHYKNC